MFARLPIFLLLSPFALVFLYAAWHEIGRFKREGMSSYGLSYDPETDSTYITAQAPDDTPDTTQDKPAPPQT
ncbi:MAG: hypothetical protein OQK00_04000 [Rhodobacteraceae bacterium]|nr:hypothetical protein [Paracoccaceae bacterium]MCW9043798.1 hypothetical protein [Pseudopelagicola sp.]